MKTFKPSLIKAAMISSGFAFGLSPALAQEAADEPSNDDVEVIQVSGIRASLQRAQAIKMQETSVVEVISAEDIGKLPDSSIAESIARLPGLAAQRLDGRASSISIRGLGENFSATTFNGREQVSIGDNRGVEFDLYPSEIMNAVVVYKTPDATLMTQGIGGTVDLRSVEPLAHGEQTISVSVRGEYNDIGKLNPDGNDTGVRGSFAYIDQFADDTIGVALAAAYMDSPNQEERIEYWGDGGWPTDNGDFIVGGNKPFARSSTLERKSLMGVLQFRPNDSLDVTLDGLYIDFEDEKILRGIEIPGAWGGPTTPTERMDGFVTQADFFDSSLADPTGTGRRPVVRNDFELRAAELTAFGANFDYTINDSWGVELDLSHSSVDRQVWSMESYAATGRGSSQGLEDFISYNLNTGDRGIMFNNTIDYSDYNLIRMGAAQSWGGGNPLDPGPDDQDGFINLPEVEDELTTAKLTFDYTFDSGMFSSVQFGVYYSDREKSKDDRGNFLTLNGYVNADGTFNSDFLLTVPEEYRVGTTSLDFIGMGDMIAYDSFRFYNDGGYIETPEINMGRIGGTWTVMEELLTGFAKLNIDTEWGDTPVTGNLGVQVVKTDQSSIGNAGRPVDGGFDITQVERGVEYTDVLPSLNLNFEVAEDQMIRLGMSKTLSRSRMDRMNAGTTINFDENRNTILQNNPELASPFFSPWSGNGGNPALEPFRANQLDLTYENYFSEDGYFAMAFFYKKLLNWQFEVPAVTDFSDVRPPSGVTPVINQGLQTQWGNTDGGFVRGLELTYSFSASMIHESLDGFGAILSATYIDSGVDFDVVTGYDDEGNASKAVFNIPVPGLSRQVYNATVFYEKEGFQARVSMRKRSDFLGEVNAISFTRVPVNVVGDEVIDAQISYDFSDSNIEELQGLTITLQGQNLTDEPFETTAFDDARRTRDYSVFGRNFLLGASYKF